MDKLLPLIPAVCIIGALGFLVFIFALCKTAREVDAALAQGDAVALNEGEVLWACDWCGAHGVVPRNWGYVPGWTWDDDGKWYCCETCADFAAGERTDG